MMAEKTITCTVCPMGCLMEVQGEGNTVTSVEGNSCPRGADYARSEFTCPVRTLTSSVKVENGGTPIVPVRSDRPIPKDRMMECVAALRNIKLSAPVCMHQVVIDDFGGTGVDIVTTAEVSAAP